MKKLTVIGLGLFTAASLWAQGTVNFMIQNPIRDSAGVALNNTYRADLYWTPATLAETAPSAGAVWSSGSLAVSFLNSPAGFINAGAQPVGGTTGGQLVWLQLRAWSYSATDRATWTAANAVPGTQASPDTAPSIKITLGNPGGSPATPAASMLAMPSHNLTVVPVPEPSTILLGLAGIGGLLFIRRKTA